MFVFTKQEQRFLLFLVITFIVGLGAKYVRRSVETPPDHDWQLQRDKLIAEFHEKSALLAEADSTDHDTATPITKKSLTGTININTASSEELQLLPRIGPATAAKIIAYRQQHGPFATIEEIQKVKSIGPKTFDNIKDYITVD